MDWIRRILKMEVLHLLVFVRSTYVTGNATIWGKQEVEKVLGLLELSANTK